MARGTRKQHVIRNGASILGGRRVEELEIRDQLACGIILLQISAHSTEERYAILGAEVLRKGPRGRRRGRGAISSYI